jgi:hypothetical protein
MLMLGAVDQTMAASRRATRAALIDRRSGHASASHLKFTINLGVGRIGRRASRIPAWRDARIMPRTPQRD